MGNPAEIEFKVDEQYENEKGLFKVISIDKNQMVIRWENGEEICTDIELQRNIAERRRWEAQRRNAEAEVKTKASRKSASRGKKSIFSGFSTGDFKERAAGTTWRSRSQLGGAVTSKIDTSRFKFNSWAFQNYSEMHVKDAACHDPGKADHQARFFVRVDKQALFYGFRVTRPDGNALSGSDWQLFAEWARQEENERLLHTLSIKDGLAVRNLADPSAGILKASEKGWSLYAGDQPTGNDTLAQYVDDTTESEPFDMELSVAVEKDKAIERGGDIAADIAQLFTHMLPLYHAAVSH